MTDEHEDTTTAVAVDDAIDVAEAGGDDAAGADGLAAVDTAEPGDPGVPSPEELMDDPGPPLTGLQGDADEHVEQAIESAEVGSDDAPAATATATADDDGADDASDDDATATADVGGGSDVDAAGGSY